MSQDALKTQGTTLTWNGVRVGDILSFSGPGGEASEIDVTDLDSVAKEFKVGLPDNGQVTIEVNLDPTDSAQNSLWDDRVSGTKRTAVITLTDSGSTTLTFEAYCKGFAINGEADGKVTASITLRVSGAITKA